MVATEATAGFHNRGGMTLKSPKATPVHVVITWCPPTAKRNIYFKII